MSSGTVIIGNYIYTESNGLDFPRSSQLGYIAGVPDVVFEYTE